MIGKNDCILPAGMILKGWSLETSSGATSLAISWKCTPTLGLCVVVCNRHHSTCCKPRTHVSTSVAVTKASAFEIVQGISIHYIPWASSARSLSPVMISSNIKSRETGEARNKLDFNELDMINAYVQLTLNWGRVMESWDLRLSIATSLSMSCQQDDGWVPIICA